MSVLLTIFFVAFATCQNIDQTHWSLFGYQLDSNENGTRGASRYERCNLDTDCQLNMTCKSSNTRVSGYCKCDYGYQWSEQDKKCLLFKDANCNEDKNCQDKDYKIVCRNSTCQCKDKNIHLTEQGTCRLKLMEPCESNDDCNFGQQGLSSYFLVCNQDKRKNHCTCKQTSELSKYGTFCFFKQCNATHQCNSDDYSNDDNMECKDGYCRCRHGIDEFGRCNNPLKSEKTWVWAIPMPVYIGVFTVKVILVAIYLYFKFKQHIISKKINMYARFGRFSPDSQTNSPAP